LAIMSRWLALWSPIQRCAGLTQEGVSQWWHAYIPLGIGPTVSSYMNRWTIFRTPRNAASPYPSPFLLPCHIQQPRSLAGARALMRSIHSAFDTGGHLTTYPPIEQVMRWTKLLISPHSALRLLRQIRHARILQ